MGSKSDAPEAAKVEEPGEGLVDLSDFLDVVYSIEIHVGSTVRTVRQVLELQVGQTLQLDRPAHENVILTIAEKPIGLAEVVASDRGSSLHITEVGALA